MNIIKELRKKRGIQQKELAIEIGVTQPTVSEWESNKKDPSGERLKKLADYFGVDELVILGKGFYVPDGQSGKSETDQIIERLLEKLEGHPKTEEARIISNIVDGQQKEEREKAEAVIRAMFSCTEGKDE